ncbi:MAG: penicillin-binding protein 2 [Desulfosalsimonadaceae bacterium]
MKKDSMQSENGKKTTPERFFPKVGPDWYRRRLLKMILCMIPVFCVLLIQLFNLQILHGEQYRSLSENNCLRKQRIQPLRGHIFDRNGRLLVDNRPAFDLYIIPADATPVEHTARQLAGYISQTPEEIISLVNENRGPYGYRPVLLKPDIGRDLMGRLMSRRYRLPGIVIQASPRRNYIYERFAPHLIGYLGEINPGELSSNRYPNRRGGDMIGRLGVERTFEDQLSGNPGARVVQVNATGQVMSVLGEEASKPGHNVYLSIDFDLQVKAQDLLEGKTGAVVAINPSNGEILAMASSPPFDQKLFIDGISTRQWQRLLNDPERPLNNRAIQSVYPPASTYKIITAMAALEEGIFGADSNVYCNGRYKLGDRTFRCWKRQGHGRQDIVDAISESCDVFFYDAGKQLGVDRIAKYARKSGFGSLTGIDLANEARGLVPTAAWKKERFGLPWYAGENLPIAIGQGYNLATPLQMGMLTAAVANGGTLYRPQIMKWIYSVGGSAVTKSEPEIAARLPAGKKTMQLIKQGMHQAVNDRKGTAYYYARSSEVPISGKTGTAQVISRLTDEFDLMSGDALSDEQRRKFLPHAWFVGYAPSDEAVIAVSVFVEHGEGGASTAGPIAKELMVSYVNALANGDQIAANGDAARKTEEN